jgi:hypothetical protein
MSHVVSLSSSAKKSGIEVDFRSIIDSGVDPGIPGGRELIALAHTATLTTPDYSTVQAVADTVGPSAAVTAVEIAGAFGMINRVMDATGSPVAARRLELARPVLGLLGAMEFPNAGVPIVHNRAKSKTSRKLRRFAKRLRR